MAAIPFSLVGILPAHGLFGAFFTATSMIGFIAGAGIVVRNSIILVDFIELRVRQGMPLDQAVVDAGAVRFRPMMLTAAAVVVAAMVILFDPSSRAWPSPSWPGRWLLCCYPGPRSPSSIIWTSGTSSPTATT